jgi:D-3-phosphoglycerate dehydrogenase/glyoxylate/hydroxypyruvate reductase A
MSILVLATSAFVAAQLEALRRLAPDEAIVSDPDAADPHDVEALLAYKLASGIVPRFARLRFVACAGVGVDDVLACPDLPPALQVTRPSDPLQAMRMAQYVTLMVLRWHRELPRYAAQQRGGTWKRHAPLDETTWAVGLMGCGATGRAALASLRALGYPLRVWTRTPHEEADVACFCGSDGLAPFLAGTRVLVCLLPLTAQTRGLLGAALFARLPRGAFVINVSRGAVLNEPDLRAALESGHLAGAALDVYAREPLPPEDPIWSDGRIVATPHIAAAPRPDVVARQVLANLARARRGEPLLDVVDRARGY